MDRGQTENSVACATSSVDTVADGVSGNEEEHVGVAAGDSNSSLDALHIPGKVERKRGRFGALRRSFKKDGGIFNTKKKPSGMSKTELELSVRDADQPAEESIKGNGESRSEKSRKEKNSKFFVRKLSLHKFKSPFADQEAPQPTIGCRGDGSRSPSQSSQDSRNQSGSPCTLRDALVDESWGTQRTGMDADAEKIERETLVGEERAATTRKRERKTDRSTAATSEVEKLEKPVSTITVVQRKSPSLTIKSIPNVEKLSKLHVGSCEKVTQTYDDGAERTRRAVSTLPYAISKWPEIGEHRREARGERPTVNTDSGSVGYPEHAQPWRKISSLDEKRAVFQRRRIETSRDSSTDTLLPISIDEVRSYDATRPSGSNTKRKARHISVTKFDTFSTFEGTFDENTGIGYLQGIDEDATLNLDSRRFAASPNPRLTSAPSSMISVMEKSRSTSQESAASQNNGPTAGLGERREHLYKILVIGELGAGKTSIIKRYVHQFFSQHYRATIGVDFALKVLNWDPHTIIRLQLWDIAGQERFGNMTRVYYKEAVGAFIVFDVTRSATLDAVVKWKQDLDSKVQLPDGSAIPCVLLANKCDQQKEGLVNSPNKMDEYCEEKNFSGWFETSAKENVNIEEAAKFLVNKILQNDQIMKGNGAQEQTDGERFALNQSPTNTKKSCSC